MFRPILPYMYLHIKTILAARISICRLRLTSEVQGLVVCHDAGSKSAREAAVASNLQCRARQAQSSPSPPTPEARAIPSRVAFGHSLSLSPLPFPLFLSHTPLTTLTIGHGASSTQLWRLYHSQLFPYLFASCCPRPNSNRDPALAVLKHI